MIWRICLLVILFSVAPAWGAGKWVEILNTAPYNDGLCPGVGGNPSFANQHNDCRWVPTAWGGGIFDTKRDRYVIWGGGHGDYNGNEIYALDRATNAWTLLTQPSQVAPGPGEACEDELADGTANSRHTYQLLEYLPNTDEMFVYSGSLACGSGGFGVEVWVFQFATNTWVLLPSTGDPFLPGNGGIFQLVYNDVDGHIYAWFGGNLDKKIWQYNRTTQVWTRMTPFAVDSYTTQTSSIVLVPDPGDSSKRWAVSIGTSGVAYFKMDGSDSYAMHVLATTGATYGTGPTAIAPRSIGLAWDPRTERIVAWGGSDIDNFGDRVWSLNLSTGAWIYETTTGGPSWPNGAGGTFGRWRYNPTLREFIIQNDFQQNLFVWKPEWVDIASGTWINRDPPGPQGTAPCITGCKHIRLTHNPDDGKIYTLGGDQGGLLYSAPQSGRQEMFTYDIFTDTWAKIQDYCRADLGVQPMGPDEIGLAWDSKRKVLWHNPGFNWNHGLDPNFCIGGDIDRSEVLSYDPVAGTWLDEARQNATIVGSLLGDFAFIWYDVELDAYMGVSNTEQMNVYDITTDTWTRIKPPNGQLFGNTNYTAYDPNARVIYIIDNWMDQANGKLWRYNIAAETFTNLGSLPASSAPYRRLESHAHWDPINQVLLWPLWDEEPATPVGDTNNIIKLYAYHPSTQAWEEYTPNQPGGQTVSGRHSVFDPHLNALMVFGPKGRPGDVFLYRYGIGNNSLDTTPPATVTGLTANP